MKPKFIVYCLAAICFCFSWKGLVLTEDIESTLEENARQSESSIMEIGMCFDWYGVIIGTYIIAVELLSSFLIPNEHVHFKGMKTEVHEKCD